MGTNRHIAAALLPAALVLAGGCGLGGEDVGPDAERMSEDPLLHIDVDGEARDVDALTGKEGGISPAMQNPDSMAARSWELTTDAWEDVLLDTLDQADQLGVVLWRLDCHGADVTLDGAKEVELDDTTEVMAVSMAVRTDEHPVRLDVRLDSGEDIDLDAPPDYMADLPVSGDCPAAVTAAFEAYNRS